MRATLRMALRVQAAAVAVGAGDVLLRGHVGGEVGEEEVLVAAEERVDEMGRKRSGRRARRGRRR